jgi:medium-chain acyl-[acyl-carrier-protein] hydrolase
MERTAMMTFSKTGNRPTTPWLNLYQHNSKASLRLFCFPYAGGAASIFRNWADHLPADIELCPVQLPGRGARMRDAPYVRVSRLITALCQELLPYLDKPFVFFGHSLGALISFELARKLSQDYLLEPLHLFVSGRRAPQLQDTRSTTYNLPEEEFVKELRRLNGTPTEVLDQPELLQLIAPTLRADFELCETYEHLTGPPLKCSITALGGLYDEDVSREQQEPWREHTSASFSLKMLPGDHFFLHSSESMLLQILALELGSVLSGLNHHRVKQGPSAFSAREFGPAPSSDAASRV